MASGFEAIRAAPDYVGKGRARIEQQRALIEWRRREGLSTLQAEDLLSYLKETQDFFEEELKETDRPASDGLRELNKPLETRLAAATQRVAHAKAVVERQRGLIVTLRKLKLSAKEAEDMLLLFLGTLSCFEHHAQDIRMALDATKSAKGGSQPEKRFKH